MFVSAGEAEAVRRISAGRGARATRSASRSSACATASARWTGSSRTAAASVNLSARARATLRVPAAQDARAALQGHRRDGALRAPRATAGERVSRGLVAGRARQLRLRVRARSRTWRASACGACICPTRSACFTPDDTGRYVELMTRTWPEVHFEFHAPQRLRPGDRELLAAVRAGARGVHTSVNAWASAPATRGSRRWSRRCTT